MESRAPGFYWIKWSEDEWQPAEWDADLRRWWMIALDESVADAEVRAGPALSPSPGEG